MIPVSQEKVAFIISVAREYLEGSQAMVSEELAEPPNSDTYTEHNLATSVDEFTAEEHSQDSSYNELKGAIDTLNEEEKYGLVALMWIGRGTYGADELDRALKNARSSDNQHTSDYLIDTPLLPDYLEEGLIQLSGDDED
ncbi:MAG: DUF3775 domain-containing protein [Kordiimonadaceae bacterium]|jgi:hypothetical protein|nr:DUF3775 domain-containing protein [Kordiimonadaceae bacterium]MBT6032762.1 DUF3775 domain-containing protein [Kordiimonadaceae bacterium]